MLEVLNFVFIDFLTFCGVVIYITAPISTIVRIFSKNVDEKEKMVYEYKNRKN